MDSGTIWINQHSDLALQHPLHGLEMNCTGAELGEEGLAEFTQLQVINIAR